MNSDFQHQNYQHHFQEQFPHQKQQMNSLTRFRSAPSSYFATFLDNTIPNSNDNSSNSQQQHENHDFSSSRPLSPETENIFASFISTMSNENTTSSNNNNSNISTSQKLCDIPENSMMGQPQFSVGSIKQEIDTQNQQMIYQSQSRPPLARQNSVTGSGLTSPTVMENFNNNGVSSTGGGLTRHSSSPAGFFSNIMNIDNGFGVMKGMGNFGSGDGQINFSSTSSGNMINQGSEIGVKRLRSNMNSYPMSTSWDDSILSENFTNLERGDDDDDDDDRKLFSELNSSENQDQEGRNRPPLLSHHLSLPKTSSELLTMEKMMQFQDSVPCRTRAKRGCATHPRSIAERVRRTRISERMRKLQDLVPNMDKQTNTADMLDLAVEYIKDLQKEVKTLTDNRDKCTCCS